MSNSGTETVIFTVGHSTRTLADFVSLLSAYGVVRIVDIRTIPGSRHNPQFNIETLPESLKQYGIGYSHMPGLGRLRKPKADSVNMGWRNTSFRGFADYMQTPEFENNIGELINLAQEDTITIMCAEAVPWRCHRSLIADALSVRGFEVRHIMSLTSAKNHKLTPWAKVNGTQIIYPVEQPQ